MCSANHGAFMVRPVHATSVSAGISSAASATSLSIATFVCNAAHRSVSFMARSGASRSSNVRVATGSPARCPPVTGFAGQQRAAREVVDRVLHTA
jgi:hypothetical protein